jgi:hypothetical protein
MRNHGRRASDGRKFATSARDREPVPPKRIDRLRRGLNDISFLSKPCYGRNLSRDKAVISGECRLRTRSQSWKVAIVHGLPAFMTGMLMIALSAEAADRAVHLQVPPPVRPDVASMPLIVDPADAAENGINAALHRLDATVLKAADDCKGFDGKTGDWTRTIDVPMRGPGYIQFCDPRQHVLRRRSSGRRHDVYCLRPAHRDTGRLDASASVVADRKCGAGRGSGWHEDGDTRLEAPL